MIPILKSGGGSLLIRLEVKSLCQLPIAAMNMLIVRIITFVFLISGVLTAQVPNLLNYQGRVAVGVVNFDGTGQFKFAFVNAAGTTTFWSNDGTSTAGSEPAAAVFLSVSKGLYSVLLGDSSVANMTAIPSSVWANADVRLRVWFNDGSNGSQLLTPDQRIAPNGYLADGVVTSVKLAAGSVGGTQLQSGITMSGTVTAENFVATRAEPSAGVIPVRGMTWIKPGKFLMGSRADEPGRSSNEGPQTFVTLTRGFWIGIHEVTQAEYQSVVGTNPSNNQANLNLPVEMVSWNDAVAYCNTLTTVERTAGRIPADWRYRLPTGAEWEYACRCGARTSRFWYGDDLSGTALAGYAWFAANSSNATQPVEQKLPNAWGLMDMHGNVYEWCQTYWGGYPGGSVTDPQGPVNGSEREVRGGSYLYGASLSRCAQRYAGSPSNTFIDLGFRIVLSN